jgi:hypothetical protein
MSGQPTQPTTAKAPALRDKGPYIVTGVASPLIIVTDDAQLAALLKGAKIPLVDRQTRYAYEGDIVTDLPAVSVPGLLASGRIVRPSTKEASS